MTPTSAQQAAIQSGEDAIADGRAATALTIAQGLQADCCDTVDVVLIHARALDQLGQAHAAIAVIDDGATRHTASGRLMVERGKILSRLGDHDTALTTFDAALAADPAQLEAVKGILALHPIAPDDPRLKPLYLIGDDPGRPISKRAKVHYILGQVFLEAGQIDQGFAHYTRANDIMAEGQDPKALEYRFATGAFDITRDVLDRYRRAVPLDPHCPAVVIAGLPRSGKTLAETLLTRSPDVQAGGELAILSRFSREMDWALGGDAIAGLITQRDTSPVAARYQSVTFGRRFVTETSPPTLFRLGVMGLMHPDVPMILCRRDPLDLCAAIFFKQFRRGNLFSTKLAPLGRAVARAERMAQHWLDCLPNPMIDLTYESTVRDPNGTADRLAALLGLPAPAHPDLPPPKTRLHPTRSGEGALTPALIGFAKPLARHLEPAMAAYRAERDRLLVARPR